MGEVTGDRARRVGDLFVEKGLITRDQLAEAMRIQQETGERLGEIVVAEFGVPRLELASVLAEQWAANDLARAADRSATEAGRAAALVGLSDEEPPLVQAAPGEPLLRRPIGEIFVERGFISDDQLQAAVELQRKTGQRLGEVLVEQGALSRLDLASALADQWANVQQTRPPGAPGSGAVAIPDVVPGVPVEALDGLAARISELERAVATVAGKSELDVTAGELRAALAALEERLAAEVAVDEERAMAAIVSKIDALRTLADEPLQRVAALEERLAGLGDLADLDRRLRVELDALAAKLDVAVSPTDDVGELRERVAEIAARPVPSAEAFEALQQAVERLGARLADVSRSSPQADVTDKLDAVAGQVEAAQTGLASLASRLDDLAGLAGRIDEVAAMVPRADVVEELRRSLTELAEQASAQADAPDYGGQIAALGARLDQVSARLGDVAMKLDDVTPVLGNDLAAELAELALRVDELAGSSTTVDLTPLEGRLDEVERRSSEGAALRDRVEGLAAVVGELTSAAAVADQASIESRLAELEQARLETGALRGQIEALAGAVDERRQSIDPVLDELRAGVERVGALAHGVDEARRRIDTLAARVESAADDDLRTGLDTLRSRLDGVEQTVSHVPVQDLANRLSALEQAVAELGGTREALAALAGSVGQGSAALDARLAEVEGRLASTESADEALRQLQERLEQVAAAEGERAARLATELGDVRELLAERAPASTVEEVRGLAQRLDGLAPLVDEAVGGARAEIERFDAELSAVKNDLEQRVRSALEQAADPAALSSLRARIDELAASVAAVPGSGELTERLGEIERRLATTVGIDAVRAELRDAAEAAAAEREALERSLLDRVHDMVGVTGPLVDELATLRGRLDAVEARSAPDDEARAAVGELRERLEQLVDATTEVGGLTARLDVLESERAADAGLLGRLEGVELALDAAERRLTDAEQAWKEAGTGNVGEIAGHFDRELAALREHVERLDAAASDRERAFGEQLGALAGVSDLEAVLARVGELESRLSGTARADDLARHATELHGRLDGTVGRGDLDALARDVHGRLGELESRLSSAVGRGDLDALAGDVHGRLGELESRLSSAVGRGDLDALAGDTHARLEALQQSLDAAQAEAARTTGDAASRLEQSVQSLRDDLAGRSESLGERASAHDAELAAIRAELASLSGPGAGLGEWRSQVETEIAARLQQVEEDAVRTASSASEQTEAMLAEARDLVENVARSVAELGARGADDAESARIADVELAARIDDVALRLAEGTASAEGALRRELEEIAARLGGLEAAGSEGRDEVERLVASVGWRLERIEESLAAGERDELSAVVERLESRLDAQAAQADEQVRVTERALRKGLAALGAQLAGTQSAYDEAGDALRRSIERLGAAVSEADEHIGARGGGRPAATAAATEFVAFAPTDDGYRLVVVDAPVPAVGDEIEVADVPGRLVVTRIGASPLPLDARPCAYLDRVAP